MIIIFYFSHGLDGTACISKIFCEASKSIVPHAGMFFKLFKLIFTWVFPCLACDTKYRAISVWRNMFLQFAARRSSRIPVFNHRRMRWNDPTMSNKDVEFITVHGHMTPHSSETKRRVRWLFVIPFHGEWLNLYKLLNIWCDGVNDDNRNNTKKAERCSFAARSKTRSINRHHSGEHLI